MYEVLKSAFVELNSMQEKINEFQQKLNLNLTEQDINDFIEMCDFSHSPIILLYNQILKLQYAD